MVEEVKKSPFILIPHSSWKSTVTVTVVSTDNITMPGRIKKKNYSAK
jgi:hypothetical protein